MTRDVRIVLLVGLIFIFLFGLVLGDRTLRMSSGTPVKSPTVATPPAGPGPEITASRMTLRDDRAVLAPRRPPRPAPRSLRPAPRADTVRVVHRELAPRRLESGAAHPPDRVLPPPVPLTSRVAPRPERPAVAPRRPARTYTVRPGDRLILIARKFWGRRNEGKYRLIYEANRDKLADENSLKVGQELVIPALPAAESPSARPARERHYTEVSLAELPGRLRSGRSYVVRPGDRLTTIARRQMGDGRVAAVRRLYEANRDRIRSPDVLAVGLKLRIPR